MNAVVQLQPQQITTGQRMNALVPTNLSEALQLADIMAKASLIPDHLRGKAGDCLLVVMQAQRWGMDAVSVAQCTSVVHGRLCFEGKLVAAALYAMGAIDGRLEYAINGTGQASTITVTGTPRGGKAPVSVYGSVQDWRTYTKDRDGNSIQNAWDKIPHDMLVYRGTRQWARRYAPEALLGVYTPDELEDAQATATIVDRAPAAITARPTYSTEDFDRNLPQWQTVIEAGRRSAADIIALAETKGALTEDQKNRIRSCQKAAAQEISA